MKVGIEPKKTNRRKKRRKNKKNEEFEIYEIHPIVGGSQHKRGMKKTPNRNPSSMR